MAESSVSPSSAAARAALAGNTASIDSTRALFPDRAASVRTPRDHLILHSILSGAEVGKELTVARLSPTASPQTSLTTNFHEVDVKVSRMAGVRFFSFSSLCGQLLFRSSAR